MRRVLRGRAIDGRIRERGSDPRGGHVGAFLQMVARRHEAAGSCTVFNSCPQVLASSLGHVFVAVVMEVADLDILQHAERVIGEHRRRAVERDQIGGDALRLMPMKRTDRPGVCSPGKPGWNRPTTPCFFSPTRSSSMLLLPCSST